MFLLLLLFSVVNGVVLGRSYADWRKRIIYQVLTDRFARSDNQNSSCDLSNYCGGNYQGLIKNLDYITGMGFDAIWISPIIENTPGSYHGYHATNFYNLNSQFGSEQDFINFVNECHQRDVWVMVDVVFNHVGPVGTDYSQINPFNSAEHYHSPCDIQDYGNQNQVETCRIAGLPDLNQDNGFVHDELIRWARWLVSTYNIDGFRIDTVKHVPRAFWGDLTSALGDFYVVGEVFDGDVNYVKPYTEVMTGQLYYPMYYTIRNVFCSQYSAAELKYRVNEVRDHSIDASFLGGFIDNHDNTRFLHERNSVALLQNALTFNFLYEWIPIVYYGTEQMYSGGNDPQNREPLWYSGYDKNAVIYKFISLLSTCRRLITDPSSRLVDVYSDDDVYVFSRENLLVVVSNRGDNYITSRSVSVNLWPNNSRIREVFSDEVREFVAGNFNISINGGRPQVWTLVSPTKDE